MFFAANIAAEQEVIEPAIMIALFIFTRFWIYTNTQAVAKQPRTSRSGGGDDHS